MDSITADLEKRRVARRVYHAAWRKRNRGKIRQYTINYFSKDPERKRRAAEKQWAWVKAHPTRVAATRARYRNKYRSELRKSGREAYMTKALRKYGLTQQGWDKMLAEQGHRCALCRDVFDLTRTRNSDFIPVVDHCHSTGRVRGLLHKRCNRALGLLGDTLDAVEKAFIYLQNKQNV